MRSIPKSSPRYQAAVRRTAKTRSENAVQVRTKYEAKRRADKLALSQKQSWRKLISPRRATALSDSSDAMDAAMRQLEQENRLRAIVGERPQDLQGGRTLPFDNHSMPHPVGPRRRRGR